MTAIYVVFDTVRYSNYYLTECTKLLVHCDYNVIAVPKNGIMDILIQNSVGSMVDPLYVETPTILEQSNPIGVLPLKEHSTLMYIYQNPNTNETAFHPVQADQYCHR